MTGHQLHGPGPRAPTVNTHRSSIYHMSEPQIAKNEDQNRYELHVDGTPTGVIDYVREGQTVDLTHTEVDPEHGGKGYAGMLADFALRDIRDAGLMVIPTCPYIAKHIERNPEFGSLVAAEGPAQD